MSKMKIGYALGGGAARGLSHIGVLKVLHQRGISPDMIAGTSIGAIIGALYAGGYDPEDIEKIVLGLDWKKLANLVDVTLPFSGLLQGKRVVVLLRSILGDMTFSQLRFPFACVATDILSGEQVVIRDGDLVEAVRASISIPGIFTPVELSGRFLVDGGLTNSVPVSICREMGADFVIGVNVIPDPVKVICNSNRSQQFQICEAVNLKEIMEEDKLAEIEKSGRRSVPSHINDIENAAKKFLVSQRMQGEMNNESPPSVKKRKTRKLVTKTPRLFDVLNQSLTISEYRLAVENLKGADMAINPVVEGIGVWQFNSAAKAIAAGEQAAIKALEKNPLTNRF